MGAVGAARRRVATPRSPRSRRLHRTSALLLALSLVTAAGAAYLGLTVTTFRRLDRAWASAMAVDRARAAGDREVAALVELGPAATGGDRAAARAALGRIGDDAADRLRRIEDGLRGRWIVDDRTDAVRDGMVEALRFRRLQMSPERRVLGDRPLERVERQLVVQRSRFRVAAATAPVPVLTSVRRAVVALRRFVDRPTGTTLVALATGRRLVTIDVDASRVQERLLDVEPATLLAANDVVIVVGGGAVTAIAPDRDGRSRWTVPGVEAVVALGGFDPVVWVRDAAGTVRAVGRYGALGAEVPMPALAPTDALLADTDLGLLVRRGGEFVIHDRATGLVVRSLGVGGRFAGASPGFVAIESADEPARRIHRLSDGSVVDLQLELPDAGPIVQAPRGAELAYAGGRAAADRVLRLSVPDDPQAWSLLSLDRPQAATGAATVAWSPDGAFLFWLTPDGRIGFADDADVTALLRAPVQGLRQIVAIPSRR